VAPCGRSTAPGDHAGIKNKHHPQKTSGQWHHLVVPKTKDVEKANDISRKKVRIWP
jgi:hypothetical protein